MRTCILVLGMHRSGTSALTGALVLAGAGVPKHLMPMAADNPTGHWEPQALVDFHDEVLSEAGSHWSDHKRLDLLTLAADRQDYFKRRLAELITEEFGRSPAFVIKDPRVCRLARLYREVLAGLEIRLVPILIVRNPLEVISSLERRDGMKKHIAQACWLRHVLDAEETTRDLERLILHYPHSLKNWNRTIHRISDLVGSGWIDTSEHGIDNVSRFFNETHQHFSFSTPETTTSPDMWGWTERCFRSIENLEVDRENSESELDVIREQFNSASAYFEQIARSEAEYEKLYFKGISAIRELELEKETYSAELLALKAREEERQRSSEEFNALCAQVKGIGDKLVLLEDTMRRVEMELSIRTEANRRSIWYRLTSRIGGP